MYATSGRNISSSAQINPGTVLGSDIANDTVLDANIGAHTTSKITVPTTKLSGTVATAQVADAAITLPKLVAGTQGGVIVYGASGAATDLGAGTSGQVVQSQGAGANPVWGSPVSSIFIPFTDLNGAMPNWNEVISRIAMADATNTQCQATWFMPAATPSSIKILARATTSAAGNVELETNMSDFSDNAAATSDNNTGIVLSDFASSTNWQLATIPAASYNALTTGRPWAITLTRRGGNGSDTLGATIDVAGILIAF